MFTDILIGLHVVAIIGALVTIGWVAWAGGSVKSKD